MSETLREVVLHGELARKYGKHHRFAVRSPAEAVRALSANFSGFGRDLMGAHRRGVAYQVWSGGECCRVDDLRREGCGRIYITPVLMGSKQAGIFGVILGAVLIVVGVVAGGANLIIAGAAMFAGGVIQLLAGVPKQDGANRLQSAFFDGPANTTAQGNPVPVGYGRLIVGAAMISAGVSIDDTSPTSASAPVGNNIGGSGRGGRVQIP
jgi:predicted phage tail protein